MEEGEDQVAKRPIVDGTRNILSPNDIRAFTEKYYSYLGRFSPSSSSLALSSSFFPSFPFLIKGLRNNLLTDLYKMALGIIPLI